ncbi:MAG: transporter related protein [Conexibacter sp.]|nr:transporter related protein [Conexibacter sp.]
MDHADGQVAALRVSGLAKAYGATQALRGASFDVHRGTVHALLGGNGSGKSTLIKTLAGVVPADAGEFTLAGVGYDATAQTPARARAGGLRFVHQQDSTFPELTIAENLAIGHGFETGFAGRVRWAQLRRRAQEVLARLEIDADPDDELGSLGSASQMMVAIARALQDQEGADDGVLVLDEPTARLPRHEVSLLLEALVRYARAGQTIVYVTHRLEEVIQVADRATVMRDGQVAGTLERSELEHERLVELILGEAGAKLVATHARAAADATAEPGPVVLDAPGLGREGSSLQLRAGEVVGVAGLLGSGRTALLRRLFGMGSGAPTEVRIDGRPARLRDCGAAMSAGVAYVPEDRTADAAFADLSITENLSVATLPTYARWGRMRGRDEKAGARRLMSSFFVRAASEEAPLSSLSGGNQQKVILARWLQRDPRLLLLDEPTQGVDVGARAEIHALIRTTVDEGAAALLVSSDFGELVTACDRVLVVRHGRVVAEVAGTDLREDTLNAVVYGQETPA